jgi:glycosyltransferase involved in cell wall biosynthesis
MRILLLNYEFPPLGGGAGNATYYLLKEFAKQDNMHVTLITSSHDTYREEDVSERIRIYYLDIGKKGKNPHLQTQKDLLTYSRKAYRLSKELCAKKQYDLVHAFFGIPCGYIAMKLGLPYVVSLRGSDVPFYNERFYWLDRLLFQRLSRNVWRRAKAVVANSEDLRALACATAPDVPISVIYNGVDTDTFRPGTQQADDFVILSTSRLIARKGIQYLLEAFTRFHTANPRSRLILAGDGDMQEQLRAKAKSSGLGESIEFLGVVSPKDMAKLYRRADVFVLPSLNEGMSNALLEAMASGLAVITTDTGGAGRIVDRECGVIVRKRNSKDIAHALEHISQHADVLERMKHASRRKAETMSWESAAQKYIRIYG